MTEEKRASHHPRLWVKAPGGPEEEVELQGTQVLVGREAGDGVILDDPELIISREHCLFERRDRAWYVMDYGSRNGTFLLRAGEMEPIRRPTPLVDGDVIRIHARRGPVPQYWELRFDDRYRTRPLVEPPSRVRVVFDRASSALWVVNGGPAVQVEIRQQERLLLKHMADCNARGGTPALCPHQALIEAVWGEPHHRPGDVTHLVSSLRKKVAPFAPPTVPFIETVRGSGYRLHADAGLHED